MDALPYHSMLAAGFITYLGGYPEDQRTSAITDWKMKTGVSEFDFMSFMATEVRIGLVSHAEGCLCVAE